MSRKEIEYSEPIYRPQPRTWRTKISSALTGAGVIFVIIGLFGVALALVGSVGGNGTTPEAINTINTMLFIAVAIVLFSGPFAFPDKSVFIVTCWSLAALASTVAVIATTCVWGWSAWLIVGASIATPVVPFLLALLVYTLIGGKSFFIDALRDLG